MQSNRLGLRATLAIFTVALFVTSSLGQRYPPECCTASTLTARTGRFPLLQPDRRTAARQSLWHRPRRRYSQRLEGVRVVAQPRRRLDGDGAVQLRPTARTGLDPQAGLILDGAGNLYGTTTNGGIHGLGTVFELSAQRKWRLDREGAA